MISSFSLFENTEKIFCVFSSIGEGSSVFGFLILEQTPSSVLLDFKDVMAVENQSFQECSFVG